LRGACRWTWGTPVPERISNAGRKHLKKQAAMGGTSMPLSRENILDTCKAARYSGIGTPLAGSRALRMYRYVRLILMSFYNLPQALPAAMASVSQPTASRVISVWAPVAPGP